MCSPVLTIGNIILLFIMCINCLNLTNPKRNSPHFLEGVDYNNITVPCGHCEECKDLKRQGVYVRLYYEYQDCFALGGFCINLTLTYAPNCLPYVEVDEKKYPCFCVSDVQKYFKRIRKHFSDNGMEFPFTYFVAMEFGGKTHRPHYHVLFFVKRRVHPSSIKYFIHVCRDKWQLGFTSCGRLGALVKSPAALNYAAKYVAKDAYEDSWYLPLIKELRERYYGKGNEAYSHYKRALSGRFLASRGLGLFCLRANTAYRLHNLECLLPMDGELKSVPLPLYLDRKLHYDVLYRDRLTGLFSDTRKKEDDVPTYVLNDKGMYFIKQRWQKKLEYATNRLKEFINTGYTNEFLENSCRCMCNSSINEIRELIKGFNLERLAAYEILYLNRRDYGTAYDDCVHVTSGDMLCDYMTMCTASVRYDIGEQVPYKWDFFQKFYNTPYSRDANVQVYRQHVSAAQKEFISINSNVFSFISFYLSQCHKHDYELKIAAKKSYVYRKSLRDMVIDQLVNY